MTIDRLLVLDLLFAGGGVLAAIVAFTANIMTIRNLRLENIKLRQELAETSTRTSGLLIRPTSDEVDRFGHWSRTAMGVGAVSMSAALFLLFYIASDASRMVAASQRETNWEDSFLEALEAGIDPAAIEVALAIAEEEAEQGRYEAAAELYAKALAAERRRGSRAGEVDALVGLASAAAGRHDYERAEKLYLESVTIQEQLGRDQTPQYFATLNRLADVNATRGDFSTAEAYFRQALELQERVSGPVQSPVLFDSLEGLAMVLRKTGQTAEAKAIEEQLSKLRGQA